MIQIKRGNTLNWRRHDPVLYSGQPGYDKKKHKIKIGDGKAKWTALPYVSGLSLKEIFSSEDDAKNKDIDDEAIITYGTGAPDDKTVGLLYLQYYDTEPEVDYIVSFGKDSGWTYQIWRSGIVKCWGTFSVETVVADAFDKEFLYQSPLNGNINYPSAISFLDIPVESATLVAPEGTIAWLACGGYNSATHSGKYCIVSPDKHDNAKIFKISLTIEGSIAK